MAVLIRAPLTLERLDPEQAAFVGNAEHKADIGPPGMQVEATYRFPFFAVGRETWEDYGRPTVIHITVEG